jgi:prepilin signal peptidase PulO-like enzyme (type II secretory pathway)
MEPLFLALIGLPVGLVLETLIVVLGTELDEEDGTEPEGASTAGRLHAESGSLVVAADGARPWLRRIAVVAATAGLFAVAGARYEHPGDLAIVTAYVSVLLLCAGTDLIAYRVPNVVTYPAIVAAIALGATLPDASIWEVLAGGALAGGVLLLPALLTGGLGMGMGDVKLAVFAGLALGFRLVPPALLVTALGGGAVAAFLLVSGLRKRGEPIPYAPFISAGALTVLLWRGAAFIELA